MNFVGMLREKWHALAERTESFRGQVVLITGANTGLGLEAAKKIAALEADKLIITTRTKEKGEVTKDTIAKWLVSTGSSQRTEIVCLVFDQTNSEDVRDFAQRLKSTTRKLDSAILNCGLIMPQYQLNSDGFEQTLAVNAVNTIYLAHLILPSLIETSQTTHNQTHLTIVSSRNAKLPLSVPSKEVLISSKPLLEMSKADYFPPGAVGGFPIYSRSKLALEYAVRNMAQLPQLYDDDKKPYVILNTVCPGATKSDMAKRLDSWTTTIMSWIFAMLFQKPTEQGANSYLTALSLGAESMGQMWANDRLEPEWDALRSEEGQKLGTNIWAELQEIMLNWDKKGQ